ncbi:hypothetical protein PPL_11392 [Heterostelium album PN500]|uniref:Uncharacterized protein n=1 Tax=Heterostelium pallidum (strain ATCC 26659 / Pp 5 / PN500) TaxID=670386 RepID=D3BT99_HETP5|nr:hypothetical protein PPL_11392 [Heterostelium album PN500]EFA75316.1 hypothetical protein PPL_11392 [Heterostelium album PN500]|eukprot:XP_020427450.1 hypothetical protein PPL_11392 [Heterostelium album PN500]
MSARFLVAFKQLFVSELPAIAEASSTTASPAGKLIEFLNPLTGDPTAKFINYASVFAVGYGLNCAINMHHDHQDVIYPYMKTKRTKTLAHLYTKSDCAFILFFFTFSDVANNLLKKDVCD